MNIYCFKCKIKTDTECIKNVVTKNKRLLIKGLCALCKSMRSVFASARHGGDVLGFIQDNFDPPELHLPGYNFCGPFTKLEKRLQRGDKGINRVDEACKAHDIAYYINPDKSGRHVADIKLIDDIEDISNASLSEKVSRAIIKPIIKTKLKFGLGVLPTETQTKDEHAMEKASSSVQIEQVFNDPKFGFTGINDIQRKLKDIGQNISQKEIKTFLETHSAYTRHKPLVKNFTRRRFYSPRIDEIWQADLAYFSDFPEDNDGFLYWLVVLDTFSKYCWVIPLRTKQGLEVANGFQKILSESKRKPNSLNTDSGTEFTGNKFQIVLKNNNIKFYTTQNEGKAMMAERLIGTFKRKLGMYMTHYNTRRWVEALNDFVYNYNYNTIHSSTKLKPYEASQKDNEHKVFFKLYGKKMEPRKPKYIIGDKIRIYKWNPLFTKSFRPNFSEEIFEISEVVKTSNGNYTKPVTYRIKDYNEEPVKGTFYENEIVRFNKLDDQYEIETVVKRDKNMCFVKWKGYPTSMNSWVDCKSITKEILKY